MKRVNGIEWITLRGMDYDHFLIMSLADTFHMEVNFERKHIISIMRRDIILDTVLNNHLI